jgi:hypothetical protein
MLPAAAANERSHARTKVSGLEILRRLVTAYPGTHEPFLRTFLNLRQEGFVLRMDRRGIDRRLRDWTFLARSCGGDR